MSANTAGKRVERLLRLIPFLKNNLGVSIPDTAKFFSISEEKLISDLNLIWLCGLPGYSHLELIDVSYDDGTISIRNADVVSRPMHLTVDEGIALLLSIENLIAALTGADASVLYGIRSKLLGLLDFENDVNNIDLVHYTEESQIILPLILKALEEESVALEGAYYSATSDSLVLDRIIPLELSVRNGYLYLKAFSSLDKTHRYFRVDRFQKMKLINRTNIENSAEAVEEQKRSETEEVSVKIELEAFWFIQKWGLEELAFHKESSTFRGNLLIHNRRWLERAALHAGGALEVTSPQEIRDDVVRAAKRALAIYENPLK